MTRGFSWMVGAALMLGGCAGGAATASGTATSLVPAPDVFTCIRQQVKAVGFTQDAYDENELRVAAHKYDATVRRPDVRFRRLVHRLAFDVDPAGGDTVTNVSAEARTFAQLTSHRGPIEEQESTADLAKEAAQQVLERCTTKR